MNGLAGRFLFTNFRNSPFNQRSSPRFFLRDDAPAAGKKEEKGGKKGGGKKKEKVKKYLRNKEMSDIIAKVTKTVTPEEVLLMEKAYREVSRDPATLTPYDGKIYYKLLRRQKIRDNNAKFANKFFN